jgi:hypothetical protein
MSRSPPQICRAAGERCFDHHLFTTVRHLPSPKHPRYRHRQTTTEHLLNPPAHSSTHPLTITSKLKLTSFAPPSTHILLGFRHGRTSITQLSLPPSFPVPNTPFSGPLPCRIGLCTHPPRVQYVHNLPVTLLRRRRRRRRRRRCVEDADMARVSFH